MRRVVTSMYKPTIGIEIHCELKTNTKMFSGARVSFEALPNHCVNEVDIALPGTLPSLNKKGVELAVRACLGLGMEIDSLLRFDRKNYFYSDLAKGFQITQQFFPLGKNGKLEIVVDDVWKEIGITRLHMEEDTAKQYHEEDCTLIDFNRSGVGLIEIVSKPQIHSGAEAAAYVTGLRELLLYLDVSDCKMEEGSLRCDVNVSVSNSDVLGTKVEIKNLNSVSNVQKAIDFEIKRQIEILDAGGEIVQETRRFDEGSQTTVSMRKKEGVIDYKYFCEPNIRPILLSDEWLRQIELSLVELPMMRRKRYLNQGLSLINADILVANPDWGNFVDELVKLGCNLVDATNLVLSELLGMIKLKEELKTVFDVNEVAKLIVYLKNKKLSSKQAKVVIPELFNFKSSVDDVIKAKNLVLISDENVIIGWIDEVLGQNPQIKVDYLNGKDHALKYAMGQVMKLSKGQVDPALANTLLLNKLREG